MTVCQIGEGFWSTTDSRAKLGVHKFALEIRAGRFLHCAALGNASHEYYVLFGLLILDLHPQRELENFY